MHIQLATVAIAFTKNNVYTFIANVYPRTLSKI